MSSQMSTFVPQSVKGTALSLLAISRMLLREISAPILQAFVDAFETDDISPLVLVDFAQCLVDAYNKNIGNLAKRLSSGSLAVHEDNFKTSQQILEMLQSSPEWLTNSTPSLAQRKRKVFVSHSKKDIQYVTAFVDLMVKMGFDETTLFCSSYSGFGIRKYGSNIAEELRRQYRDYDLFVIYLISKDNYYSSDFCMNEMGAAWVLMNESVPILLPGTQPGDMRGVVDSGTHAVRVGDEGAQTALIDLMIALREYMSIKKNVDAPAYARDVRTFIESCLA